MDAVGAAIRRYDGGEDRAACLGLFDTNVPDFFLPEERSGFGSFLDELPGPYFVMEDKDGRVVACGGYALADGGRRADLCWGMVDRSLHGRGLGRQLVKHRVEAARRHSGVQEAVIQTSQHTKGFYRALGFDLVGIERSGFGPGMDRCTMRLGFGSRSREPAGSTWVEGSQDATSPRWVADRPLDAEGAGRAIARDFPDVDVSTIEWLGSGWEFDVYRAGAWAFRFPRRREYAEHFAAEGPVLDLVCGPLLPVRAPAIELKGRPGPDFPYPFTGHRFIAGGPADAPDVQLHGSFAEDVGSALGRLHSVDPDRASTVLPIDDESLQDWLDETLDDAAHLKSVSPEVDRAIAWLESGPRVPPRYTGPLRLVHNDLCPDHLLIGPESGRLVAIIDWTDACLGDPVLDFVVLWAWLGEDFVVRAVEAYEPGVDAGFHERLRFSARVRTLHWLHSAMEEGGDVDKHRSWVTNAFA